MIDKSNVGDLVFVVSPQWVQWGIWKKESFNRSSNKDLIARTKLGQIFILLSNDVFSNEKEIFVFTEHGAGFINLATLENQ